DDIVGFELRRAWLDSQPATAEAHEEGGFVLLETDGRLSVERWPRGLQNEIAVPAHPNGRRGEHRIVATFHTHPNPGSDFQQQPSLTDIRAVRDDPDLNDANYEGEYIIATENIYRVTRDGDVQTVGATSAFLRAWKGVL